MKIDVQEPELLTAAEKKTEDQKDSFAIIGTRDPDEAQVQIATNLAWVISWVKNCIVKTGAAIGIDQKAMNGTQGKNLHVYLPWKNYNLQIIPPSSLMTTYDPKIHRHWADSVNKYHPAPDRLSHGAFLLHARNYGIIEDCKGVIALPGADGAGGTGQGIRIANALNIPVIQGNKGSIINAALWMGKALQLLGLADSNIPITILPKQ